jgi:isopenicillin-N N-acyltransferase like protein
VTYPTIHVEGSPRARGEQHGAQAAPRVHHSIAKYRELYAHFAGLGWEAVLARAKAFVAPINEFDERYVEEMRGIAAGASVGLLDVLAINLRTEIINSSLVAMAGAGRVPAECTAIGVRRSDGTVILGQNWDYFKHCRETTLVMTAVPDDDTPAFVTVVEAGLLSKIGMNAHGVSVVSNALAVEDDTAEPGVPFHVLLRALLESPSVPDACDAFTRARLRSSTGNYMLGSADDLVDLEAWAGDGQDAPTLEVAPDEDGVIIHANHCVVVPDDRLDAPVELADSSRHHAVEARERINQGGGPVGVEDLQRAFMDHAYHPVGICVHEDPEVPEIEHAPTCASLVMAPAARTMLLADGNPCTVPYRELDTSVLH